MLVLLWWKIPYDSISFLYDHNYSSFNAIPFIYFTWPVLGSFFNFIAIIEGRDHGESHRVWLKSQRYVVCRERCFLGALLLLPLEFMMKWTAQIIHLWKNFQASPSARVRKRCETLPVESQLVNYYCFLFDFFKNKESRWWLLNNKHDTSSDVSSGWV